MPQRKNNSRKPSETYGKKDGSKPSYGKGKPAYNKRGPENTTGKSGGYKKKTFSNGDPDELAAPRFLAPRNDRSPYARKGNDGAKGRDNYKDSRGSRPRSSRPGSGGKFKTGDDDKSGYKSGAPKRNFNGPESRPPYRKRSADGKEESFRKPGGFKAGDRGKDRRPDQIEKRPYRERERGADEGSRGSFKRDSKDSKFRTPPAFDKGKNTEEKKPFRPKYDPEVKLKRSYTDRKKELLGIKDDPEDIRLNKFLANSGICSRREADELISQGLVSVNGTVMTELGYKVKKTDVVRYDGRKILPEPFVYILMNKPKDFITSTEDDKGRKTVMDLLADKIPQRVYPIGRLDRNTTGVLLLTNDGEVAQALTHPSFMIKKVYHVVLDKKVSGTDLDKIVEGVELEDGHIHADAAAFIDNEDRRHVGIEIHSGRNRIVRRMFEFLGYDVEKLDRVSMGIFTKKDLPRGKWRFLKESEIGFLMKLKSKLP